MRLPNPFKSWSPWRPALPVYPDPASSSLWHALKAKMTWGGQGGGTGLFGWRRFDNLQDPWPRDIYNRGTSDEYDYIRAAGNVRFNATVAACVAWMQRAFPEPTLQVTKEVDGKPQAIPRHPLVQLLRRPNPYYSGDRFWQAILSDWIPTGNAYARKVRDRTGQVVQLWHVPESRMRPDWPQEKVTNTFISRYLYSVGGEEQPVPVEDVIHFRFGQDPENERLGWSPLRAGLHEIGALNTGAEYRGALLSNYGTPSAVLTPTDIEVMRKLAGPEGESIIERLKSRWRQETTGRKRGNIIIPSFPSKLEKLGFSPTELDIVSMLAWDADMVCALIGLNSMVVGLPAGERHRTYANMGEAKEQAIESNLIPTQKLMGCDLDIQLLPDLGDPDAESVTFDYSRVRVLQEDENEKWERVGKAKERGLIDENEARQALGYPPWTAEQEREKAEARERIMVPESRGDAEAAGAARPGAVDVDGRETELSRNGNGNGRRPE